VNGPREPVNTRERHARACVSTNLAPGGLGRTDLDVLIAAGVAAQCRPDRMAALRVYRMIDTGDTQDLWSLVNHYDGVLHNHLLKKTRRPMHKQARVALIHRVLYWLMHPGCEFCGGTGLVAQDGTAGRLTGPCEACHGTGVHPLSRSVPHAYGDMAAWLVDQIDAHGHEAIEHMKWLLRSGST
jgi:hypothetical protein